MGRRKSRKDRRDDRERLRQQYEVELKSTWQIAKEWGVSQMTIVRWLKRFGIASRDKRDAQAAAELRGVAYHLPRTENQHERLLLAISKKDKEQEEAAPTTTTTTGFCPSRNRGRFGRLFRNRLKQANIVYDCSVIIDGVWCDFVLLGKIMVLTGEQPVPEAVEQQLRSGGWRVFYLLGKVEWGGPSLVDFVMKKLIVFMNSPEKEDKMTLRLELADRTLSGGGQKEQ